MTGIPVDSSYVGKTRNAPRPGELTFLTTGHSSDGVSCLGLGERSPCVNVPTGKAAAALLTTPAEGLSTVLLGAVPRGTAEISAQLPGGNRVTFRPSSSGPIPSLRYFAHSMRNPIQTPVRLTLHDKDGGVIGQLTAAPDNR